MCVNCCHASSLPSFTSITHLKNLVFRLHEKKVMRSELIEFLQRALRSCREQTEGVGSLLTMQRQDSKSLAGGDNHIHSHRHSNQEVHAHPHSLMINLNFLSSERMAASSRKRYGSQVSKNLLCFCMC